MKRKAIGMHWHAFKNVMQAYSSLDLGFVLRVLQQCSFVDYHDAVIWPIMCTGMESCLTYYVTSSRADMSPCFSMFMQACLFCKAV
jgi:hypothetical protein